MKQIFVMKTVQTIVSISCKIGRNISEAKSEDVKKYILINQLERMGGGGHITHILISICNQSLLEYDLVYSAPFLAFGCYFFSWSECGLRLELATEKNIFLPAEKLSRRKEGKVHN